MTTSSSSSSSSTRWYYSGRFSDSKERSDGIDGDDNDIPVYDGYLPIPYEYVINEKSSRKKQGNSQRLKRKHAERMTFTKGERAEILYAKGGICANCGMHDERYLQIHHKDSNPLNDTLENLEALCYVCHKLIHQREAKASLSVNKHSSGRCLVEDDTYKESIY